MNQLSVFAIITKLAVKILCSWQLICELRSHCWQCLKPASVLKLSHHGSFISSEVCWFCSLALLLVWTVIWQFCLIIPPLMSDQNMNQIIFSNCWVDLIWIMYKCFKVWPDWTMKWCTLCFTAVRLHYSSINGYSLLGTVSSYVCRSSVL